MMMMMMIISDSADEMMNVAVIVMYSDEHAEDVEIPEMVEPQKVLVMLPREPQSRSVGHAPGECTFLLS